MESIERIPLFLITGFLGSGKTTFLKKILKEIHHLNLVSAEKKIGIIENEFGDVGIDGKLLEDTEIQLTEIDNGSIFCSCRHDSFIDALESLSKQNLAYLFIECSGISDPSPIKTDLEILERKIGPIFDYRGCISIIDGETFFEAIDAFLSIPRQIKHSNITLINKSDLISDEIVELIKQKIYRFTGNTSHPILITKYCSIQFFDILAHLNASKLPPSEIGINKPQNQPQKVLLETAKKMTRHDLHHFLLHFAQDTFRIKGFCNINDELHYVDGVSSNIKISPFKNGKLEKNLNCQLVVILKHGDPLGEIIKEAWLEHFK